MGDAIKLLVHNSAARSEAAATALKSELVLDPLALPPPPPPLLCLLYPTWHQLSSHFPVPTLLSSLAHVSRSHLVCVAVPWSLRVAVERFFEVLFEVLVLRHDDGTKREN